jgi:hypothetical protein
MNGADVANQAGLVIQSGSRAGEEPEQVTLIGSLRNVSTALDLASWGGFAAAYPELARVYQAI